MAIVYSYPKATPTLDDMIIGTKVDAENGLSDNQTVNYTISSLIGLISSSTGEQNLQQVTNVGAVTNLEVTFQSNIKVAGSYLDSNNQTGTLGQVLSSTVGGTQWTNASSYTLPLAADGTRGGVQIGYVENGKNYPVELSSEKMFVNVPWTDTGIGPGTQYTLPIWATTTTLGDSIVSQNSTVTCYITGTGTGTVPDLEVKNTGDTNYGAKITLQHESSSPANNDIVGTIDFNGRDSASGDETFASIQAYATNVSSTGEEGILTFNTRTNTSQASNTQKMKINNDGAIKFNLYGQGNFTGTAIKNLSVDNSGNIIETATGGSGVTVANVTVTASQLLNLNSSPITVIAAPGAGKGINIQQVLYFFDAGSTVYNFGSSFLLNGYSTRNMSISNTDINGASDYSNFLEPYGSLDLTAPGFSINSPLVFSLNGVGQATQGDGVLYLSVAYKIIDIGSGIQAGF